MSNRITGMAEHLQKNLQTVDEQAMARLEKAGKISLEELVAFQRMQSQAYAAGKISLEESNHLYNKLGCENPTEDKWMNWPLHERLAVVVFLGLLSMTTKLERENGS